MEKKYFVHPQALCESEDIGNDTRVWAFAHVMKGVRIGSLCNVCDHSFIESGVTIGDRVTIKNGVAIWEGVTVEDDVFLGPNCVMTNDLFPRSRVMHEHGVPTLIKRGASVGANATIVAGNTLGEYCMIGAGSVVIRDIPPFALMVGNPCRRIGWVGVKGERLAFDDAGECRTEQGVYTLRDGLVSFERAGVEA